MGRVEEGTTQLSVTTLFARPGEPAEYAVAVLRILARKDVGEPLLEQERESARLALRLLGKEWR